MMEALKTSASLMATRLTAIWERPLRQRELVMARNEDQAQERTLLSTTIIVVKATTLCHRKKRLDPTMILHLLLLWVV